MNPTPSSHPLKREGHSQQARDATFLDPKHAPLDDRTVPDLLVFIWRYAKEIRYFNHNNQHDGDWQALWEGFPIVQLSLISQKSTQPVRSQRDAFLGAIDSARSQNPINAKAEANALRALLDLAFQECLLIDRWALTFEVSHPFYADLAKVIDSPLRLEIQSIVRGTKALFRQSSPPALRTLKGLRSALWKLDLGENPTPQESARPDPAKAQHLREDLEDLFEQLLKAFAYLKQAAEKHSQAINADGQQTPHLGLALAFLKLFEDALVYLNDLTRRHLIHYYQDILQLKPQNARADRVVLLFELAKRISDELLPAGTAVDAGKDATKQQIAFELSREVVISDAILAEIRNTRLQSDSKGGRMLAGTIANSSDGLGGELSDEDPSWTPFGGPHLPGARYGFAIACDALKATGGIKVFTLEIELIETQSSVLSKSIQELEDSDVEFPIDDNLRDLSSAFYLQITAAEGWLPINASVLFDANRKIIYFSTPTQFTPEQAFTPHRQDIHLQPYPESSPILEVLFTNSAEDSFLGPFFQDIDAEKISLIIGVNGDTELLLANDSGPIDPAKPFFPFGSRPSSSNASSSGSRFYIGSEEIFSKQLSSLTFSTEWKDAPENPNLHYSAYTRYLSTVSPAKMLSPEDAVKMHRDAAKDFEIDGKLPQVTAVSFKANAEIRRNSAWATLSKSDADLLNNQLSFTEEELEAHPPKADINVKAPLNTQGPEGFMRFTLASPSWAFGHRLFPQVVTEAITSAIANKEDPPPPPPEPYTPTIANISATYTATAKRTPEEAINGPTPIHLWHIEPHGVTPATENKLLPKQHPDATCLFGIEKMDTQESISLFFQTADNSGNPFAAYPDISWSYLSGEQWIDFEKSDILLDSTNALRQSGIVRLAVPKDATLEHTRMPTGKIWIRAAAFRPSDSGNTATEPTPAGQIPCNKQGDSTIDPLEALNRLIAVYPHAAEASFIDRDNDLGRLESPLPAGSITKLLKANSRIKTITQPLPSEQGTPPEQETSFFRRTSERLRHKDRAIQIWDYEHLILQAFPEIHRVKCIPHSNTVSELAPGEVLLVLIPKLDNEHVWNPLKPAVTQDTLANVEAFVRKRISPFICVRASNPSYEEIEVIADITLRPEFRDVGVYEAKLQGDLKAFLTPWSISSESAPSFGQSLHPSQIINFLDELPYVDFIENFKTRHYVEDQALKPDPADLIPTSEAAILVSRQKHDLHVHKSK